MFFTEVRRISGSAETTAAMSSRERPAPESRARIASGLEAGLMREEESSSDGLLCALDKSRNAFLTPRGLGLGRGRRTRRGSPQGRGDDGGGGGEEAARAAVDGGG